MVIFFIKYKGAIMAVWKVFFKDGRETNVEAETFYRIEDNSDYSRVDLFVFMNIPQSEVDKHVEETRKYMCETHEYGSKPRFDAIRWSNLVGYFEADLIAGVNIIPNGIVIAYDAKKHDSTEVPF